jgi:hypothetical protein
MSLSAERTLNWILDDFDTSGEYRENSSGVIQTRDHYILNMNRRFVKLRSWTTERGESRTTFAFETGGGVTSVIGPFSSKKFICSRDKLQIIDHITGEGIEAQVWEHYTKWEDVDNNAFEM